MLIGGLVIVAAIAGTTAPDAGGVAIVAAVVAVLLSLSLVNLWRGLLGMIAVVVLLPAPFSTRIGGATITPGRALLFALLVGWLAQRQRADLDDRERTPLDLFLWLVVGAMIMATIANVPRYTSSEFAAVIRKITLFSVDFFLLFGVAVAAIRVKERAIWFLKFLTVLITGTAVLGLVERFTERNVFELLAPVLPAGVNRYIAGLSDASVLTRGLLSRVHGTFEQPLSFAIVLLIGLPLAAAFALAATTPRGRLLWGAACFSMGGAILFTASRGAYLILGVTLVTMLVLSPDWRARRAIFVASLAFVGVGLLQSDVRETMSSYLFNLDRGGRLEGGLQNRVDAFDATTTLLADKPLLGFGPGSFATEQLGQSGLLTGNVDRQVLDNGYLEFTGETGAIGIVALTGLLLTAWLMAYRFRRAAVQREDRLLGAALVGSIQAWILFAFFADVYVFNAPPKLFFALLAAVAVLRMSVLPRDADSSLVASTT
ncbi:MAG: hypothetical protein QOI95_3540 [Acidimicrobiaceae bacterium]